MFEPLGKDKEQTCRFGYYWSDYVKPPIREYATPWIFGPILLVRFLGVALLPGFRSLVLFRSMDLILLPWFLCFGYHSLVFNLTCTPERHIFKSRFSFHEFLGRRIETLLLYVIIFWYPRRCCKIGHGGADKSLMDMIWQRRGSLVIVTEHRVATESEFSTC